ncbi:ISAs1 family transposase [Xenorhabdus sp. Flor]|uniref:ISAs1 family transposase n=1 Tax=Xenorhabdus cabanillasii TaxID=351673 RepID=UPI001986EEF8|nr:ISAs1 family transposase [Xenorhabdus sp. Flor]
MKIKNSMEIKSIPRLIQLLDIKGCLVSIDAMGCQTQIAEKIIHQGGDYLLAVKVNQERLYRAASGENYGEQYHKNVMIEQNHGRIEVPRISYVTRR